MNANKISHRIFEKCSLEENSQGIIIKVFVALFWTYFLQNTKHF